MTATASAAPKAAKEPVVTPKARLVLWLSMAVTFLEGYDLAIMGVAIPVLMEDPQFMATTEQITTIATMSMVGMMIGAMLVGPGADKFGRKGTLIASTFIFSVCTLLGGAAPTLLWFGIWKVIAGIGLGAGIPTVVILIAEYATPSRRGLANGLIFFGYNMGAFTVALLGMFILTSFGWRSLFFIGGIPGLILMFLIWRAMPESPDLLRAKGRYAEAQALVDRYDLHWVDVHAPLAEVQKAPLVDLFHPRWLRNTLAIYGAAFAGLLMIYGLNTWLPMMMREAGYNIGSASLFLAVLNFGTAFGLFTASFLTDRFNARTIAAIWFVMAAIFLSLMRVNIDGVIFVIVAIAGFFAMNAQVIIYALNAATFPVRLRATAVGSMASVGRLGAICGPMFGGMLIANGLVIPWGFYGFGMVALFGAVCTLFAFTQNRADAAAAADTSERRPAPTTPDAPSTNPVAAS